MTTTTTDQIAEIHQRALDRAKRIYDAFVDATDVQTTDTAMLLGAAFHAAADTLRDEADAATERRKKGWQSYVKELQQVAARLVGIAQDLAELSKLDPPATDVERPSAKPIVFCGDEKPHLEHEFVDRSTMVQRGSMAGIPSVCPGATAEEYPEQKKSITVKTISAYREVSAEEAEMIANPPPEIVAARKLLTDGMEHLEAQLLDVEREQAETQFFADREPYTAATDPATSQADVMAYLRGDTNTMPDNLTPELLLRREVGDEVGAPSIEVYPTLTDIRYVINSIDVTHAPGASNLPIGHMLDSMAAGEREAAMTLRFEDPLPPAEAFGPKLPPGVDASARRSFADLMKPVDPALFPEHWSWSQLTTSEDCGLQSRLARLEGVKQIPQWANVGGSAFHAATEAFDRGAWRAGGADLLPEVHPELIAERWNTALEAEIARVAEESGIAPGEEGEHWRASNRGKENLTWWRVEGERMLAGYIALRRKLDKAAREAGTLAVSLELPSDPMTRDLNPCIEREYIRPQPTPAGILMVKGVIDRAYRCSDGSIMIKDLKTSGRVDSTSTGQLGEYAQAILHLLNLSARDEGIMLTGSIKIMGCFYDARRQLFTEPVDLLAKHPSDEYAYRYGAAEAHRRLGVMQPHRSSFCVSCSVAWACPVGSA